jgi:hypothetical protein
MHIEENLGGAERELERALGTLRPSASALGRDQLFFRAGQKAGRRSARPWMVFAVAQAALLAMLLVGHPEQPQPQGPQAAKPPGATAPELAAAPVPSVAAPAWPTNLLSAQPEYLKLRQAVLEHGLDALPVASSAGGENAIWPFGRGAAWDRESLLKGSL